TWSWLLCLQDVIGSEVASVEHIALRVLQCWLVTFYVRIMLSPCEATHHANPYFVGCRSGSIVQGLRVHHRLCRNRPPGARRWHAAGVVGRVDKDLSLHVQ